ncbi:uncharacterized protein LODBEIA_P14150 [Lodderomyces beijingensis]|uniref:Vps41 beta-propeller domain-containing protein n=1 Tax=Lodderomyces beijingensis TaxID=1775926 RepID=A0ABP0ZJ79_9ASCO
MDNRESPKREDAAGSPSEETTTDLQGHQGQQQQEQEQAHKNGRKMEKVRSGNNGDSIGSPQPRSESSSNFTSPENEHLDSVREAEDTFATANEATVLNDTDYSVTSPSFQPEKQQSADKGSGSASASEDENDDDDETEPPKLKYSRITQLPPNFFTKDPVSSCTFSENYFIFATHSGVIHICKPNFESVRTFKAHRASVLSVFTDGTFFASASMDGTVVIGSILDVDDIIAYDFHRPVHAIILLENYASKRSFITGGMSGEIIFSTKGWLGKKADYVYSKGTGGAIVGLYIVGNDLIVWMNDEGTHFFQISNRKIVKTIPKPSDSPRSDLYWPRVIFEDPDRLVIAWSNYIWSLKISLKSKDDINKNENEAVAPASSGMSRILPSTASISFRAVQEKKIEIEHIFKLQELICGIASFKDDLWMILAYAPPTITEDDGKTSRQFHNPELKLINSMTGEVEFEQELGLRDVTNLGLNDFKLGSHIERVPVYYIISAKDGVVAEEYQLNDRLEWYLSRENYIKAWELGQHLVTSQKRLSFGIQHVDSLIKDDEWTNAANFLVALLPYPERKRPGLQDKLSVSSSEEKDRWKEVEAEAEAEVDIEADAVEVKEEDAAFYGKEYEKEWVDQWTTWANIFIRSGHVEELTEVIPRSEELPKAIFTEILLYWVDKDSLRTRVLVNEWSTAVYDVDAVQTRLKDRLAQKSQDMDLERSLVTVYDKSGQQVKAVAHLVKLQDRHIVAYLHQNQILYKFISQLPKFIELQVGGKGQLETLPVSQLESELSHTIDILVEHRLEISPNELVRLFQYANLSIVNYFYLLKLGAVDSLQTQNFGNELIKLFADFNRSLLLPYLTDSDNYNVDKAIEICQTREFYSELIYLLGKIGEYKQAINLVIHKLEDAKLAIEFATRLQDQDTWNTVVEEAMSRPRFIRQLIATSDVDESINRFYDPVTILCKMDEMNLLSGKDANQSAALLKQSIVEFDSRNQSNKLINQIILAMIVKQSQDIAKVLKDSLLRGVAVDFEDEGDPGEKQKWHDALHNFDPVVL